MAVFTTLETVGNTMTKHNARLWRLKSSNGDTVGLNLNEGENNTAEKSFTELSELVESLMGDWVEINLFKLKPSNKGAQEGQHRFTYKVQLSQTPGQQRGGAVAIQGFNQEYVDMKIQLMQKDWELKQKDKELSEATTKTVDGVNYEKEIFGFLKDWLTEKKIVSGIEKAQNKNAAAAVSEHTETEKVEPGTIATMVQNIKPVMNGQTMELFDCLSFFAKNDPETFKAQATQIINGVTAFRQAHPEHGKEE